MPRKDLVENLVEQEYRRVREIYPDVFIGGGYLRDRTLGVRPVDVDFFTFMAPADPDAVGKFDDDPQSASLGEKRIVAVQRIEPILMNPDKYPDEYPDELLAQIIHLDETWSNKPWGVAQKFLFGAQQIFWTPDQFGVTDAFQNDVALKRFTVTRCMHEYDAWAIVNKWMGTNSYAGLKGRFQDWSLAIPLEWYKKYDKLFCSFNEELDRVIILQEEKNASK